MMKTRLSTLFFFLLSTSIFAQVYVNQAATGNNDGSSWDNAFTSLVDALDNASSGDEIWVANGIYKAGQPGDSPDSTFFEINQLSYLYGGFAGNEASIDERDIAANPTILNGDLNGDDIPNDFTTNREDNGVHVLEIQFGGLGTAIVDGFIIEHGAAKLGIGSSFLYLGGGIFVGSLVEIRNCTFRQNMGSGGAAVSSFGEAEILIENCEFRDNFSETGTLQLVANFQVEVTDCLFENNEAVQFGGAATVANNNAFFENCSFQNNRVPGGLGAGIFALLDNANAPPNPVIEIINCDFTDNEAAAGAGFYFNNENNGDCSILVEGCGFADNVAEIFGGGAVVASGETNGITTLDAQFHGCTFHQNSVTGDGGGGGMVILCGEDEIDLNIDSCMFENNSSTEIGGGMFIISNGTGDINSLIENTSFIGNLSEVGGSGVFISTENLGGWSQHTIRDNIFKDNIAGGVAGGLAAFAPASPDSPPVLWVDVEGSDFSGNVANGTGGAVVSVQSKLSVTDCDFNQNTTGAALGGGGAIAFFERNVGTVERSSFKANLSSTDGAAIYLQDSTELLLENVLLVANEGSSTITLEGDLTMRNTTMTDNVTGILQIEESSLTLQNSLFVNNGDNYSPLSDDAEVTSLGGNLSDDTSMSSFLIGGGGYADFNEIDPLLDANLTPTMTSPCVDAGNPDGIDDMDLDILGNDRIQGSKVDIGAFESPFIVSSIFEKKFQGTVNAYPTPFSNVLNVEASEMPTSLRLFDARGQLIKTLSQNETQIFFEDNIIGGVYFLEWQFESGVARKMVIKK